MRKWIALEGWDWKKSLLVGDTETLGGKPYISNLTMTNFGSECHNLEILGTLRFSKHALGSTQLAMCICETISGPKYIQMGLIRPYLWRRSGSCRVSGPQRSPPEAISPEKPKLFLSRSEKLGDRVWITQQQSAYPCLRTKLPLTAPMTPRMMMNAGWVAKLEKEQWLRCLRLSFQWSYSLNELEHEPHYQGLGDSRKNKDLHPISFIPLLHPVLSLAEVLSSLLSSSSLF